jgi:hypothetical protein
MHVDYHPLSNIISFVVERIPHEITHTAATDGLDVSTLEHGGGTLGVRDRGSD